MLFQEPYIPVLIFFHQIMDVLGHDDCGHPGIHMIHGPELLEVEGFPQKAAVKLIQHLRCQQSQLLCPSLPF